MQEVEAIKTEFSEHPLASSLIRLPDPVSQCDYLIMLGFAKQPVPQIRTENNRIAGCQTAIWVKAAVADGKADFLCDSDSLLVRGILSVYEQLYQGERLTNIRRNPPDFLSLLSDQVIDPQIRQNGLWKCYQKISFLIKHKRR